MTHEREIHDVLARYVRAHDKRDGVAMASLFLEQGRVEIAFNHAGIEEPIGELAGRPAIVAAVAQMMTPHPVNGWSHNATSDAIITVEDDRGTFDAQFMVFSILGTARPAAGWPSGATGAQGSILPIESGYYRATLRRLEDRWLIETLRILSNLPMAF